MLRLATRGVSCRYRRAYSTISSDEINHFNRLAARWWDPSGELKLLHRMNEPRIKFLKQTLLEERELPDTKWLEGKTVLDVGCGAGIFSESLARLGGDTTGVDAAVQNVQAAKAHASLDPKLCSPPAKLHYQHCAAEDLVEQGKTFDVVCAMEVVEHVDRPRDFLDSLIKLAKPGGHILLSTISRTPLSRLLSITMAENVLRLVSPGTHTYDKFIKPDELRHFFEVERQMQRVRTRGCIYDPIAAKWHLLDEDAYGGLGELANYFASVKVPAGGDSQQDF